jgi:sulfur-oxidizing protein SoxZ
MSQASRIRAQLQGDTTVVRVLLAHDMESGQRKDGAGRTIPAWFIQAVQATHNGRVVMSAQWGTAVARNPFLQFSFKGGKPGDKLAISWIDNRGERRTDEAVIAA